MLIALLDETPRHGYDIMAELSRLFGPRYRPSPGSIYPAIDALQTEGLIVGEPVAGRVVYRTTETGRVALMDRADMLAVLELRVGVRLGQGDSLDAVLTRFRARLAPLSGRVEAADAERILDRAAADIERLVPLSRTTREHHHA